MFYALIIVVIGAIGFVAYYLISSSKTATHGLDEPETHNQGPAPIRQELAAFKDSAQKAELNYSLLQKELELEKRTKASLEEELTGIKTTYDKLKSECDLFKIENASLKGKLMERDRDNRKMIDELKILREKSQSAQKEALSPTTHAAPTQAKETPAPAPEKQPNITTKIVVDTAPVPKPVQAPVHKPISVPNATPDDLIILTDDDETPPVTPEKSSVEKTPSTTMENKKNAEPENKQTNFKLVGEDENDDKTQENKDLQNPQ